MMLTSRITAPPPPPISGRLRWNIACTSNWMPLDICPIISPSVVWLGGVHFTPSSMSDGLISRLSGALHCNNASRSRNSKRDILHSAPSTRREISGATGKHSKPPPNRRRRPIHGMGGAFVCGVHGHYRYSAICRRKLSLTAEL